MSISLFDIFKIGIGPSSSHTMGPMTAACRFVRALRRTGRLDEVCRVDASVFGSLASTGRGHCTDKAIVLGLQGFEPAEVPSGAIHTALDELRRANVLRLGGSHPVPFAVETNMRFYPERILERHVNGMTFIASGESGTLLEQSWYSIGGGFVISDDDSDNPAEETPGKRSVPYDFRSAEELLQHCRQQELSIAGLMLENERRLHGDEAVVRNLDNLLAVMDRCIEVGIEADGELPGVLCVPRRAPGMYRSLLMQDVEQPTDVMSWINLYALAVNEENAAGGRIVTAPTNGAAGIIPAVLRYYRDFVGDSSESGLRTILLAAGAIGLLYKRNASFSAAELGCQGEVGVACSMAAAGLAAALGGSNEQVENAAEIGMEHNLGLTCDPIAGLVQIPCIERNAIGAVKAVNSAAIALRGDGRHKVSLDQVIATMKQTGRDMASIYKETSQGGLAVNVPEC